MKKNILVVITVLILSLSMLSILKMNVAKAAPYVTLQDAEIATQMVDLHWGSAQNVVVNDISGPGVEVTFNPATAPPNQDKLALADGYAKPPWTNPVSQLAGGALDVDGHNGNFMQYTAYELSFTNKGTDTVSVALFMNTGYTGAPNNDQHVDTFWQSDWADVAPGATQTVILDFSSARVFNAMDDPVYPHIPDDTPGVAVWRLDQVSTIGFQMLSSKTSSASVDVVVQDIARLYLDPSSIQKSGNTDIGTTFTVTVNIQGVNDFYGFDIEITWDNSLMTYSAVDYTTYLNAMWGSGQWLKSIESQGAGFYRLVAVCTHVPPGFSASVSQAIFKLTFTVVDPLTNSKKTAPIHFSIDKLSDSNSQSILHTTEDGTYLIWGKTPTLSVTTTGGGNSRTCRELNEPFYIIVGISDAASLTGINIKINYDKDMISYQSGTVNWGTGTVSDDGNGQVTITSTGSVSASTLATITLKSNQAFTRIWRDPSTGQSSNTFSSSTGIYLYSATLSYPDSQPPLSYSRGESPPHQINPPTSDISYSFMPIKGDMDNNGIVGIGDLTAVASHYDTNNADYNLIGGSPYLVDIFDLVVIASNFWYTYTSTP